MNELIFKMKEKGYDVVESDFNDWDGGEIHYHDVSFSKVSLNIDADNF